MTKIDPRPQGGPRHGLVKSSLAKLDDDDFVSLDHWFVPARSSLVAAGFEGMAGLSFGSGLAVTEAKNLPGATIFSVPPTISLSGSGIAYTQNFDTLASSGTSDATPDGWTFSETGTAADTTYAAGTGSGNAGNTYSFGATDSGERALGGLLSGSLTPIFGASFTNETGSTIVSLLVSYTGEQWRLGTAGREDRLDFQISFDATSLTTGSWIDIDALDFVTPNTITVGAKDGNAAENQTELSHNITGLSIANGATFWIRWTDFNASGADDGLAVDDFSLTPTTDGAGAPGTLSIDDVTLAEGDAGTTAFTFTVTRSGGSDGEVSVDWAASLPGGVGGADASDVTGSLSGTVTFADGETSQTITILVNGDLDIEPDETFTITLSSPTGGASLGDAVGVGTILNDDNPSLPVASIDDVAVVEGNAGVSYLTFTVSLSFAPSGPVTLDFATADGTATAGSDYLALSGQVSFVAGETSQTISVPIVGDTRPEADETFAVTLSNPSGATIGAGTATGTIVNDDGPLYHALASGDFSQDWSNIGLITGNDDWSGVPHIIGYLGDIDPGTTAGIDPRTLTGPALGAVDVIANLTNPNNTSGGVGEFHLANPTIALQGSGTADAPSIVLYMDATGRSDIRLQANLRDIDGTGDNAVQPINVQYRTDPDGPWINVPDGYFADVTEGPNLATLVTVLDVTLPPEANGAATLQIRIMTTNAPSNDEWVGIDDIVVSSQSSGPSLSIADAAAFEGNAGTTDIVFTVTRAGDSAGAVTADWQVNFGTGPFGADAADFAGPLSGLVSFADGQTIATITVTVQGDTIPEGDEGFTVSLSNVSAGAAIGDGVATGTIVNDDGAPILVHIDNVSIAEGDSGTSLLTFTVTRTGGTDAFDVDFATADVTATAGEDYVAASGTLSFAEGQNSQTISITINGDTDPESTETFQVLLSGATNDAIVVTPAGTGTIVNDEPIYIHDIQGTAYFSPILASEGIQTFNTASSQFVTVQAIVTAVDNVGNRQGFYITEEYEDWDGNRFTSEGIFVMTRNDAGVGDAVSGVAVGDLVTVTARVMEYQGFSTNMPITALVNPSSVIVESSGHPLPTFVLDASHPIPNAILTGVEPDYFDSFDDIGDSFDADLYALSYFETVEGMLVTIPDMVVADGFVGSSGGRPFLQAYSTVHANPEQINDRGGYTIAGDPPHSPPDTDNPNDGTSHGGRHLHDGDVNPDIVEIDFTGFAIAPPPGLAQNATMGDLLGDVTGIIDFDFSALKLYVTDIDPGAFVDTAPVREVTLLGNDDRSLTVATFNVENLDPGDGAARFMALAEAIMNNLNSPDIICIEEMQDNNGPTSSGGADASVTWQMLVDALNTLTGANYQWVDQEPVPGAEGGEPGGNIRVGFLYNTDRVQLGTLDADASLAERRQYTDRIGDGVRDSNALIAFSDDMIASEINPGDWSGTRLSLLGEFTFNGNIVYVTANHWQAKGGSGEFWQFDQTIDSGDPANAAWARRNNVAQDVYAMLDHIQAAAPDAGIVAGGDFNDFYFYRPLEVLTGYVLTNGDPRIGGSRFDNLTLTLAEAERYTYTFDGRSQAIDHIVANQLLSGVATYDIVHINTGYNANGTGANAGPRLSDHDPGLASFDFRSLSEVLRGTDGDDVIDGFGGNDVLYGFDGNDALIGGSGIDILIGGDGNDFYYVDDAGDVVIELSGEGNDRVLAALSYALAAGSEVERLTTTNNAGTDAIDLTGNELANVIYGNAGSNVLNGGAGNDQLYGLDGNDVLIGGAGADVMKGGVGDDLYFVDDAADTVFELSGEGNDRVYASVSYTLTAGQEIERLTTTNNAGTEAINLSGNALSQIIYGNAGNNILDGRGGGDLMVGLEGDDSYYVRHASDRVVEYADGGNDRVYAAVSYALEAGSHVERLTTTNNAGTEAINLSGNAFDQIIYGNAGDNVLDGKGGNDTLVGLGGADTFAFTSALGPNNVDRIADFEAGIDRIALDDAIFTGLGLGTLDAGAFVVGSAAGDADDRIVYNQATGQLFFDADGSGAGAAILFATLTPGTMLTNTDFIVV